MYEGQMYNVRCMMYDVRRKKNRSNRAIFLFIFAYVQSDLDSPEGQKVW